MDAEPDGASGQAPGKREWMVRASPGADGLLQLATQIEACLENARRMVNSGLEGGEGKLRERTLSHDSRKEAINATQGEAEGRVKDAEHDSYTHLPLPTTIRGCL